MRAMRGRVGMSERNSSREQTNMVLMCMPATPAHKTLFDKTDVACTITNSDDTHGQSAPESTRTKLFLFPKQ